MIYIYNGIPEYYPEELYRYLPEERLLKINRYINKKDRILCFISYCLFAYGINAEYGINEKIEWKYEKNKKPYIDAYPFINFNISHCDSGAVCAFSNNKIGVDMQNYSSTSLNIMNLVCSRNEIKNLEKSTNSSKRFINLWCLKESYVKYTGEGLTDTIKTYDFYDVDYGNFKKYGLCFSVFDFEDYCLAICSDNFFDRRDIVTMNADMVLKMLNCN